VANLEALRDNRQEVLRDYVADRRAVIARASEGIGAWVLPRGRHADRTDALVRLLREQGIEVSGHSDAAPPVSGLHDILTGAAVDDPMEAGAWLVRLDQPAGALARVLLDPHVPMEAEFLAEEREYQERGRGTRLYETTAWSLVLSYGVEAYWTREIPTEGWTDVEVEEPAGSFQAGSEPFGYLLRGGSDASVAALADLLQRGLTVRVADKPFVIGGETYERGTLLLQHEGNPEDLAPQLAEVAQRWAVQIAPTPTAKAAEGPDLGGRHFRVLQSPRIGIWTGFPVSPTGYGALWHLLDQRMGTRFAGLDLSRFNRTDLRRYNVLIFPPAFGGPNGYRGQLGKQGLAKLTEWIEGGGTAIGIGSGAQFLADKDSELTQTRMRRQALDRYPPVVLGPDAEQAQQAGLFRAVGIAAEQEADDKGDGQEAKDKKRKDAAEPQPISPYDVAPLIGAGAAPFAEGVDSGTPVSLRPVNLADWVKPYLAPGQGRP
jgi:hypothetical protein